MAALPGLVMKDGADGVMAGAFPDGRAFALKIASGVDGARQSATGQALRVLGIPVDDLAGRVPGASTRAGPRRRGRADRGAAVEFLTLDPSTFTYGAAQEIAPLVRRVIAENPSKFTYHGTGTYIVGGSDVVVIDPGPQLDSHRDALHRALAGCTVRAILVTHCHADHSPLAAWLTAETGAPTIGFGPHLDDRWDIGEDPIELEPETADPKPPKPNPRRAAR